MSDSESNHFTDSSDGEESIELVDLLDRVSALEDVIYTHLGIGERPNTRMDDNREDIDDLTVIIDNILGRLVEIESRSNGGTGGTGGGRTRRRRRKKRTRRRRKRKGKTRRKRRR